MEEENIIKLFNDEKISEILQSKNHLELAKFLGKEHCGFTADDEKYVDMFWEPTFNKSWLYVSNEMVSDQFGYKKGKYVMKNFYKRLEEEYENNVDYKEVDDTHELVKRWLLITTHEKRVNSSKKHYIITGETYKNLLQAAKTLVGKLTRKYYIKVENLGSMTNKVIFKYIEYIQNKQIEEQNKRLLEHKEKEERLHNLNAELLTFKKLSEKNETVYILSTLNLACQGLFKVGQTKNIKLRSIGHNTTHPIGDKTRVLAEFKVNNATTTEYVIKKKLDGLRPSKDNEYFLCPYDLLYDIIGLLINLDDDANESVNKLIDEVFSLRKHSFNHIDWTAGLDRSVFEESIQLITDGTELARFDVTNSTEEQKQEFIKKCVEAYKETIPQDEHKETAFQLIWETFKEFLIKELGIPKSRFKPTDWKPFLKREDESNQGLVVVWRKSK